MLYSPEPETIRTTAFPLPRQQAGNQRFGQRTGQPIVQQGAAQKEANKQSMGRRVFLSTSFRRTALLALLPVLLMLAIPHAKAQSASAWNKRAETAESHEDWDTAY